MSHFPPPICPSCSPKGDDKEEQAFETYRQNLDPIEVTATDWHNRWTQGLSSSEDAEFKQWLVADPAHDAAFQHLVKSIHLLRSLPADKIARLRSTGTETCTPTCSADKPSRRFKQEHANRRNDGTSTRLSWLTPRPAFVAVSVAALLAGWMGWYQWQQPVFTDVYATERGKSLSASLPDGSTLSLDVVTRTDVALYRDRREVRVADGQVMFSVAPDPSKPFHVLAGQARIIVVGTRFSVRYRTAGSNAGTVDVAVEEGTVTVSNAAGVLQDSIRNSDTVLTAGTSIQVSANGTIGEVHSIPIGSVAPWRRGLIHFFNTPLSEAIQEMDRYSPTKLVIEDKDVAALRIGGAYEVGRPDKFARLLPQIFPVRLAPRNDGMVEIVSTY